MPYFTIQITPLGPIVDAFIAVSAAKRTALIQAKQPIPPQQVIRALIDTGASCTCIDPSVLTALNLTPTGSTLVNTPSTGNKPQPASTYDVSLTIPCGPQMAFSIDTLEVVESLLVAQQGFHVLIGRDVLKHCHFSYDGRFQLFTLAY